MDAANAAGIPVVAVGTASNTGCFLRTGVDYYETGYETMKAMCEAAGGEGGVQREGGVWVVYTREAETADAYIEKVTYELAKLEKERRVRVVTSDGAEQLIILGHGTLRVSARMFRQEMDVTEREIEDIIAKHNARRG